MSRSKHEIQVGAITIIAAVVLIVGMMWLKQIQVGSGSVAYSVDFHAVEGLQVGDRVQVRGIRLGTVTDFEILGDFVRVDFNLSEGTVLCDDTKISLATIGIVGEVVIEIDPGVGAPVQEGHIFKGNIAGSITTMTDVAGEALREKKTLATEIRQFVAVVREDGKVVDTLEHANLTIGKIDTIFTKDHNQLKSLLNDFSVIASSLREIAESDVVTRTFVGAEQAVTRADSVLTSLEQTSHLMRKLMTKIDAGEGTAGKLLADDSLYARAESTLNTVNRLMDDIRRNPKRYFKFSVVDF